MPLPNLPKIRVLLTRPLGQSTEWAKLLAAAGAEPVLFPTITVGPPVSWNALDESLSRMSSFQWVVFTSAAAATNTLSRLSVRTQLQGVRVAAVGRHTASVLQQAGVNVDLVPPEGRDQNGQGLAKALSFLSPGAKILFPQATGGRPELRNSLIQLGCTVEVVAASETLPITPFPLIPNFDVATFASPSAFHAFVDGAGVQSLVGKVVVVLGDTTAEAVRVRGLVPHVAEGPTGESMVLAISRAITA
jgi:uroporphyrinogen-III synthase